ncbi:unnamed protein product [Angiostrongylus costaricensis]|uniref:LIM zinc-binding domain-containing protein n=1 Tax=Angiostrongylus costaricensis TaxID=334426 RepID=A0A0R3PTQ7_ANGCS|nr:unnamed protein product [Angiostrongylus costaricensis]
MVVQYSPGVMELDSPSLRGVPSSANYGSGHYASGGAPSSERPVTARPVQIQHEINPPPMPVNPPSESRVPPSVRSAVSPKRSKLSLIQWPPTSGLPTVRYWQIDPSSLFQKEKQSELNSLQSMVEAADREAPKKLNCKQVAKRLRVTAGLTHSPVFRSNMRNVDNNQSNAIASPPKADLSASIPFSSPDLENGVQNESLNSGNSTVTHQQESIELRPEYIREVHEVTERCEILAETPKVYSSTPLSEYSIPYMRESNTQPSSSLRVQRATVDCSTSPIPTIELPRRRSATAQSMGIIRALSPIPFSIASPKISLLSEQQFSETIPSSPKYHPVLVDINTTSTPPSSSQNVLTSPIHSGMGLSKEKFVKKVEFSKATIIPDLSNDVSNAVDETDVLTQLSPASSEPFNSDININVPYDGDISEICDNKSDTVSSADMDFIDEKELWMKEELELARKEELAEPGDITRVKPFTEEKEEWRQQAMALLNDESQTERDMEIVTALNKRLEGIRDMQEIDRQRAIDCIERHQRNLEGKQVELNALLNNAIEFLKNLETTESSNISTNADQRSSDETLCRGTSSVTFNTQSQCDDMSDALMTNRQRFHSPGDFISEHLGRIMANDEQSFTRSTFEQRVVTGGSPAGSKPIENRGQGSLNYPGGRIPYCEACKQQIRQKHSAKLAHCLRVLVFRGAFVLATGLTWCPEHFVCAYRGCGRRLLECGFVEEHGSKYCESCFEAHIAPRCAKCSKPIVADCLNAMQKKWHPTCFTCAHCRKPFGNTAFYLENGLAYCENDWNALFTTKCVACKYPIEAGDRWVEALGNAFHSNCFNCTVRKFPNTEMQIEIIINNEDVVTGLGNETML